MTTHAISAPSPPAALRAARVLLGLMGAVVVYGSIYFSVVEPPQSLGAADWAVGAWALATGVAALAAAARLGSGDDRVRRFAIGLLALHVVFGAVKVVGYDEPEAATFMAVDAILIATLSLPAVRRWFS